MANIMTFLLSIQKKSLLQVWTEVQKPGDCWRLLGQVCLPDPTSHIFGRNSTFACSTPYSCREILALWWHPMFFWPLRSNLTLWKTWWTSHFFAATVAVLLLKPMLSLSQLVTSAWACWFSGMASGFRLLPSGKSSPWLAGEIHRLYNGGFNGKVTWKIWEQIPTHK